MTHHDTALSNPFDLLASNVLALRTTGKWSTRALARQAHVSRSTIVDLEKGQTNFSLRTLDKLAEALEVKTSSLVGKRPVARGEATDLIEAVLAHNLATARKRLMFTQEQLSQHSGINRAMIANIERQARNPSLQTLARLAEALDLSIEGLLTK